MTGQHKAGLGRIERADVAVGEAAASARDGVAVRALGAISELADQPPLISICMGTLAAGLLLRNDRLARAGGRMLAAELLATGLKNLVKHRVDRTRPRVVDDGGGYRRRRGGDHASEQNSFPSGHTAGAVAVAGAFAREYPEHRAIACAAAIATGAIQLPRGQHYVSDIVAGAIVGLVAEVAIERAETLLARACADPKLSAARGSAPPSR